MIAYKPRRREELDPSGFGDLYSEKVGGEVSLRGDPSGLSQP